MGTKFYKSNCLGCAHSNLLSFAKLLTIPMLCVGICISAYSQTSLSFTQISSGTEVKGPGRGAEQWYHLPWDNQSGHGVEIPSGSTTVGQNYYYRFSWKDFESDATQGSYDWTLFDRTIHQAIDAGQ